MKHALDPSQPYASRAGRRSEIPLPLEYSDLERLTTLLATKPLSQIRKPHLLYTLNEKAIDYACGTSVLSVMLKIYSHQVKQVNKCSSNDNVGVLDG